MIGKKKPQLFDGFGANMSSSFNKLMEIPIFKSLGFLTVLGGIVGLILGPGLLADHFHKDYLYWLYTPHALFILHIMGS